ncbi:hypothetical protein OTERR_10530 [Oryzomicrobium terrae]|uniref:Serine aminopeptidase S33 domain-containing protein n=1 Tax=Oryzomicrobium terrae TaxID=1735038 RepID=A0A5C1E7G0_9RHOO|nr:alpha/beta hydrolase [Oryzomicrobium terrae]QEL64529.1 hypothetical protein OTERR_10530 [Oryzomicrobium terrae]
MSPLPTLLRSVLAPRLGVLLAALLGAAAPLHAQTSAPPGPVVEIPSRDGVSEKFLYLPAAQARATVILFAGGHGGLQLLDDGSMKWGNGNFLVRTRAQFVAQGFNVAVLDAPSDRQSAPFLTGFRQTAEHVADVRAVIAWLRRHSPVPVWLVGTSRGTQSAAYVATRLAPPDGPDGLVLTSSILTDPRGQAVPELDLSTLAIPVLVVHHRDDGCKLCSPGYLPRLMDKLGATPRHELLLVEGGSSQGDPCEAWAYHGYNGKEAEVVGAIAAWIGGAGSGPSASSR